MTDDHAPRFPPGSTVYVRWRGSDEYEIVRKFNGKSLFPHWVCKRWGGQKYDYFVFPQIHLSKASIEVLAKESNRKQLTFF